MRIRFSQHTDVNLCDVPSTAWGALGIHRAKDRPSFRPDGVEMAQEPPKFTHYFRKNWPADLPDAIGQRYIDAGVAERAPEVIRASVQEVESAWPEETPKLPAPALPAPTGDDDL